MTPLQIGFAGLGAVFVLIALRVPIGVALGTDYLRALVSCVVTGCYHHVTKQHGIKSEKVEETWPDRLTGEPRTTGRRLRTAPLVVMDPGDIENALSARHTPASDIEFMADLNALKRGAGTERDGLGLAFLLSKRPLLSKKVERQSRLDDD